MVRSGRLARSPSRTKFPLRPRPHRRRRHRRPCNRRPQHRPRPRSQATRPLQRRRTRRRRPAVREPRLQHRAARPCIAAAGRPPARVKAQSRDSRAGTRAGVFMRPRVRRRGLQDSCTRDTREGLPQHSIGPLRRRPGRHPLCRRPTPDAPPAMDTATRFRGPPRSSRRSLYSPRVPRRAGSSSSGGAGRGTSRPRLESWHSRPSSKRSSPRSVHRGCPTASTLRSDFRPSVNRLSPRFKGLAPAGARRQAGLRRTSASAETRDRPSTWPDRASVR